jgi:uncharacterized protein with HEPN domain
MQHDLIRLQHMLDAGKDAIQFSFGRERNHLENDRMLALALIKALEIIGKPPQKSRKISNRSILRYLGLKSPVCATA